MANKRTNGHRNDEDEHTTVTAAVTLTVLHRLLQHNERKDQSSKRKEARDEDELIRHLQIAMILPPLRTLIVDEFLERNDRQIHKDPNE